MAKLQDELDELREAARDLAYQVFKALGMIALVRRLGLTPKPWIRDREQDAAVSGLVDEASRANTSPHGGISFAEAQKRMAKTAALMRARAYSHKRGKRP